jgi:hypothetical protein
MYPSDAAQAKSARPNQHEHGATPRPPQTSPAPAAARCSFLLRRLEGRLPLTAPLLPVLCGCCSRGTRREGSRPAELAGGARRCVLYCALLLILSSGLVVSPAVPRRPPLSPEAGPTAFARALSISDASRPPQPLQWSPATSVCTPWRAPPRPPIQPLLPSPFITSFYQFKSVMIPFDDAPDSGRIRNCGSRYWI